jgi:di/tricarboxylate transporter
MNSDMTFVFGVLLVAAAAMASNRIRFDLIAIFVVLALMLSGVLSVGESLSGFGSPVVILVAGLLVIGEMLDRTGVARAIGDWIIHHGGASETRLLVMIMLGAAGLGAVMSSTAIVAIFIPIILRIAAETGLNSARMLMPMAYAALISGMLTLIATPPNLVVTEELQAAGFAGFGFFSFTPVGLAVLAVAIGYILLAGRRLLAADAAQATSERRARRIEQIREDYSIGASVDAVTVGAASPLVGNTIGSSAVESRFGVRVLGLMRREGRVEKRVPAPSPDKEIHAGDQLLIVGRPEDQARLQEEMGLHRFELSRPARRRWFWEAGGAVVLIHPESSLIGKSIRESEFRSRFGLHVLGLRRGQEPRADFEDLKLAASDSLFVVGSWTRIQQLQAMTHEFVVLEMPAEHADVVPKQSKMPVSLAILAGMVLLSVFNVVPLVAAVIMAVVAAIVTRCLTMEEAYRAIHWSSIVLVAGMLPLADALNQTGGTDLVVDRLMSAVGESSPGTLLTVVFFLTSALGLFLSNTAAAVLVAPIAITAAQAAGISPYPLAVAVVIAASAAFVTPVSTPVVTLVVEPGRYRFVDFVKVGVPLLLLAWAATLLVAPRVFPY